MALRFRSRHVQQTMLDRLQTRLTDLGWVDAPVNFATTPITFMETEPEFEGAEVLAPNTVAVTLLSEAEDEPFELGGGLFKVTYIFAVDIFGATPPVAQSIASDVKDVFTANPTLPIVDYTGAVPTESDEYLEITDVTVVRPPLERGSHGYKLRWRTVQGRIVAYFQPGV